MARAVAFAVAVSMVASTAACAVDRYAGIDLDATSVPEDVRALAKRARSGDNDAQFQLGQRYEAGCGVPVDRERAIGLYRRAAADRGGTHMRFYPARNGSVTAVPVNDGALVRGLPEARARLAALESQPGVALAVGCPDRLASSAVGSRR